MREVIRLIIILLWLIVGMLVLKKPYSQRNSVLAIMGEHDADINRRFICSQRKISKSKGDF